MPTTRHLINSRRRRQARDTQPGPATPRTGLAVLSPDTIEEAVPVTATDPEPQDPGPEPAAPARRPGPRAVRRTRPGGEDTAAPRRRRPRPLTVLCLLTLLLGGFAGWAHARAAALSGDPARQNTALTDLARTSEIKGQTGRAVAALFSYDHADPDAFDRAARTLLTGKAVDQHAALLGEVAARADEQKAVITTTVTDSAVERIDGDRARVLVYADQSSVSTAGGAKKKDEADDEGVYAGAMFAVDVVHRDGRWLVTSLDTFGR
ncbi:hypothetical protein [Streptomyces sp. BBFR102]|uniref:hypothetical protein n=1 Tax=Streptomyces sp. BBFR102 TaxID=3448171 RepID=UPI003F53A181